MKLDSHFRELLTATVNLPPRKLGQLGDRVESIYAALTADDEVGDRIISKDPQGSWAQKTIIRPRPGREFDADFMLIMKYVQDWDYSPRKYIDALYRALRDHGTYGKLNPTRKCRCVRLAYANDFHVDIVPLVDHPLRGKVIVNRDDDRWESSNPEGFTDWMHDRDAIAEGNLRRVIRLVKYIRDHHSNFTGTKSIILTTLLGERVNAMNKFTEPGYYTSTATALKHIVGDLDDWLQERPVRPSISVPGNTGLTFDHRWTDDNYRWFRDRIHVLAADIAAAHDEEDKAESIRLWQAIFGDSFRAPAKASASGRFGATTAVVGGSGRGG